jgi:hypothetical protein
MIVKLSNFTPTNKWEGQGKKRRKRSGWGSFHMAYPPTTSKTTTRIPPTKAGIYPTTNSQG